MDVKKVMTVKAGMIACLVIFIIGFGSGMVYSNEVLWEQLNKLKDVLVYFSKDYVDDVDLKKLTETAIEAMLKESDPHSTYFPAQNFERVTEEVQGKYQGVGLQIFSSNDTITVAEPMGGGPAIRLGILANDRIVKINDTSVVKFSVSDASKRLRGPKGTKVKVTIKRAGVPDPMEFEITRDEIPLYTVEASFMIDKETGYATINKFGLKTTSELEAALDKLKQAGMKRLILDLRGNPGGVLDEAVSMADLFLDSGPVEKPRLIVYTKARSPRLEETHYASSGQAYEKLPLIVLVDNSSASASEIVAGALQDWDRGLIVGETTFGKGLVQRQYTFSDGSAMRLTIAKYYTPSGRLIQRDYKGKDADTYRHEAFVRDEEEGENIDHNRDTSIARDTSKTRFKTFGGRTVYGGGGITPDYVVKPLNLTPFTTNLLRRDLFSQFMRNYLEGTATELQKSYKHLSEFVESYEVSDEMIVQFKEYLKSKSISVNEDEAQKDLTFIKTRMKAYVARHFWSNEGWYTLMLSVDSQFQRALNLFPEAAKLARLNK